MKFTFALMLCIKLTMSGNLLVRSDDQGAQVQGNLVLQRVDASLVNQGNVSGVSNMAQV